MAKRKTEDELYNINSYTDKELFDILDLNNPTDRELEAKIIALIYRYQNLQNASATKLANFFEDIYSHFFDTESFIAEKIEKVKYVDTSNTEQNDDHDDDNDRDDDVDDNDDDVTESLLREGFAGNVPIPNEISYNNINANVTIVGSNKNNYQQKELDRNIHTGFDYEIHYDLLNFVEKWCDCENVEECKEVLQGLGTEKEIFLGEFVKALLKINNISSEFEKIAEMTGNIAFLSKLREIPNMTLKYVVTNQSLYV